MESGKWSFRQSNKIISIAYNANKEYYPFNRHILCQHEQGRIHVYHAYIKAKQETNRYNRQMIRHKPFDSFFIICLNNADSK